MSVQDTPDTGDIRPQVASPSNTRGLWIFGAGLVVAGALLFQTLEARRAALVEPSVIQPKGGAGDVIASPPELDIPSPLGDFDADLQQKPDSPRPLPAQLSPSAAPSRRAERASPPPARTIPQQPPPSEAASSFGTPGVSQMSAPRPSDAPSFAGAKPDGDGLGDRADAKERVQASRFKNPGTTVPKGVVIQAVLETALDSNRPGFARAIVSRDIYAFDGSRILIQRGSRLVGEYKADLTLGQKRVLVEWQRLMRPDGVVINLDSPAADPLGRAGVGGKVNSHFFQRFAGAILQSTLDLGTQLASQRLNRNTYVLALPGTTQGLVANQGEKIPPTIIVRQGSSVSVFVAHDLDFTDTDR